MLKTLYNGFTGMSAQMQKLDVTGNNIANVDTVGFKRQSVSFDELLRQRMALQGLPVLSGEQADQGSGVKAATALRHFTQGNLNYTGRELDLAIQGDGFFAVTDQNGEQYYTRDGSFLIDAEGQMVNSRGLVLLDERIPTNYKKLVIDQDGFVTCEQTDGTIRRIGQIETVVFTKPDGLIAAGDNLFQQSETSGEPQVVEPGGEAELMVVQGALEGSNVDLVMEVQSLIEGQRSLQLNAQSINTADQLWSVTNNLQK